MDFGLDAVLSCTIYCQSSHYRGASVDNGISLHGKELIHSILLALILVNLPLLRGNSHPVQDICDTRLRRPFGVVSSMLSAGSADSNIFVTSLAVSVASLFSSALASPGSSPFRWSACVRVRNVVTIADVPFRSFGSHAGTRRCDVQDQASLLSLLPEPFEEGANLLLGHPDTTRAMRHGVCTLETQSPQERSTCDQAMSALE